MSRVKRQDRLVRLRTIERRSAVSIAAEALAQVDRTTDQIARLELLSQAISPGAGVLLGGGLAAAGEYVTRLANGYLITERRLYRQTLEADAAHKRYAVTDVRLQVAERLLDIARRSAERDDELRRERKRPARARPAR
ncbi:hypothetical protein D3Y57_04185 (plasmid) [Sphingomonas paeninsulae]|uniref:Flagellar FliJ protein n=1 Tax=Sphingomonas paeninsulae TaxID=2319844 RepID=A0A494THC9_SPHPE|nr:hypothetical protein [Sphingomonas paeninsulae]AYJ85231.1 hypothetical protein D3Y57_04185 [Sphingomonas paeninsulae]